MRKLRADSLYTNRLVLILLILLCIGSFAVSAQSQYNEAPMLREMVENGELPPVAERLPDNPAVLETLEVGTYGGTLRRAITGPGDYWGVVKLNTTNLLFFDTETFEIIPWLAENYEVNEDGTEMVIYLRPGTKWSDGVPYTVDDIIFTWRDVGLNEELNPIPRAIFAAITDIEKIDDYTARFIFDGPAAAAVLTDLNRFYAPYLMHPKHYAQQFHPDYADEAELNALVAERGFTSWMELFNASVGVRGIGIPGHPVLTPWMPVNSIDDQVFELVRNPYFFAVDAEGNQLPYIDRVQNITVLDHENLLLQITQGNIDIQARHMQLSDAQVLAQAEADGDYTMHLVDTSLGAPSFIRFVLTNQDPVKAEIAQDVRFRQALSLAINRAEIQELNYFGLGTIRQASFLEESPAYNDEWTNGFTEYDPDRARALLDELGLERDSEGFLLRPDNGERLIYYLDTFVGYGGGVADLELIKGYWEAVGLRTEIRVIDRTLYDQRGESGELDTNIWPYTITLRPDSDSKQWDNTSAWRPWYIWFQTDGAQGEEPLDQGALRIMEINEQLTTTASDEGRIALMREVAEITARNLYYIGWVGRTPLPIPVNNNLRNVPVDALYSEELSDIAGMLPYQWYFANQ